MAFYRSGCPGGVGNLGFNSFNFMTFVLLTLNAVANTNNNINNNNNNNVDINYNTINQDSNNVISNSENMNMIMAVILPVPGRSLFNRTRRSADGRQQSADQLYHQSAGQLQPKTIHNIKLDHQPAENKKSASGQTEKQLVSETRIPKMSSPFIQELDLDVIDNELGQAMLREAVARLEWIAEGDETCEGWRVCMALKQFSARQVETRFKDLKCLYKN